MSEFFQPHNNAFPGVVVMSRPYTHSNLRILTLKKEGFVFGAIMLSQFSLLSSILSLSVLPFGTHKKSVNLNAKRGKEDGMKILLLEEKK